MITADDYNTLMVDLGHWLTERGWRLSNTTHDYRRVEVWIMKQEPPPDLGINVRDGVGSEDRVGG
jgi:hypothetical protein